jgi:hypothetical protein
MSPRFAVHILGLCNLVAGALVAWAPSALMPGLGGLDTSGARLLGASLGVMLAGAGAGAWVMPPAAVPPYLWLFGVGVKLVGAVLWGWKAQQSGVAMLWAGAALDVFVALVISGILLRR